MSYQQTLEPTHVLFVLEGMRNAVFSSFFWAQQCLKPHPYIISCLKMFLNGQRVKYWSPEREIPPDHTVMPVCIPQYTASMLCKRRNYWI